MGATDTFRCLGKGRRIETEISASFYQWARGVESMILTLCLRRRIHLFIRQFDISATERRFYPHDAIVNRISKKLDPSSLDSHNWTNVKAVV